VCCIVLQCVAVCRRIEAVAAVRRSCSWRALCCFAAFVALCCSVLQCVVVCCSVFHCVAVCYSVLAVGVRCGVLQGVSAVSCNALQ